MTTAKKRRLLKISLIFLGSWIVLVIGLYYFQEELIFLPRHMRQQVLQQIRQHPQTIEEINLTAADGTKLHGWLVKNDSPEPKPLIIYFGGNAEEISWTALQMNKLQSWSVALINYRGYGWSQGKTTQDNLYADSLAIYDYFAKRSDINKNKIVSMGRSLGTGVAVYLAAKRNLQGVVLVTPYDSILRIAQNDFFFVPVSWMLKHRFDSLSYAPSIKAPLLCIAAKYDAIIPPQHAQTLFDAWAGSKTWELFTAGHGSVSYNEKYWPSIVQFLNQLK